MWLVTTLLESTGYLNFTGICKTMIFEFHIFIHLLIRRMLQRDTPPHLLHQVAQYVETKQDTCLCFSLFYHVQIFKIMKCFPIILCEWPLSFLKYHCELMDLNIFDEFQSIAINVCCKTQIVPSLFRRNLFMSALESLQHCPSGLW